MAFLFPILLTVVGLIAILVAYGGIRQGTARVYSLEREAILRRATAAMFIGAGVFIMTISMLLYQMREPGEGADEAEAATAETQTGQPEANNTPAPNEALIVVEPEQTNQIPSLLTVTLTPTLDPNLPTATPTPVIVRAFVTGTGGNGLYLRAVPGGEEITILGEDEFVTVQYEEGTLEQGGFTWVKVRTFLGDEGWVAEDFLEIVEDN